MAKLNRVKTLDMQNGEITRIEYEGTVYTKVDKSPEIGDLAVLLDGHSVIGGEIGAFYEVLDDTEYGGTYIDTKMRGNVKVTFNRGYAHTYRKVDTELTVGDRVKALRSGEFRDIARGEYGEIIDTEFYKGDDPYYIVVTADDGDTDYFRPQDLELVKGAKTKIGVMKVGQPAKIVKGGNWHPLNTGDIVEVLENEHPGVTQPYFVKRLTDGETAYLELAQLESVTPAEYETSLVQLAKDAVFAKAGRKPNEYRKGDIVRVLRDTDHPELVGKVEEVADHYGSLSGGNVGMKNGEIILGKDVEIVCFAEDRKDVA